MMLSIVLADRSTVRVESCPVPVMVDFPEWRVYAHHVITEDGVDESRWVATEARTGHSFPGEFDGPDTASLAAMARLRRWGKPKAADAFVRARRHLERLGIEFPVNDVGSVALPSAVKKESKPREGARLWLVLDVIRRSRPLTIYEIAQRFPAYTVGQIQRTVSALRAAGLVFRVGSRMNSRYYVPKAIAA